MKMDKEEFRAVASAVLKYNTYAEGDTVENIVDRMESLAYMELHKGSGYLSTYGFVLSAYRATCGEIGIKASVSASLFRYKIEESK